MGGSKKNDEESLVEAIKFYQSGLIRYLERNDELKMSHGLNKLSSYPIRLCHLQDTGVGRTVNLLVNKEGKVGEQAKLLIKKWKKMVEREEQKQKIDAVNKSPQSSCEDREESNSSSEKSLSDKNNSSDEEQDCRKKRKLDSSSDSESASNEIERHKSRKDERHKSSHDKKRQKDHSSRHEKYSSRHEKEHSSKRDRKNDSSQQKEKYNSKEHSVRHKKEHSHKDENRERDEGARKSIESTKKKTEKNHKENDRSHCEKNKLDKREEKSRSTQEKNAKQRDDQKNKENSNKDEEKKISAKSKEAKKSNCKNVHTEISSGTGTSFEEALGMMQVPRKEKKSVAKENIPSASTSYKNESSSKILPDSSSSSKTKLKKEESDKRSSSSKRKESEKKEKETPRDKKAEKKEKPSSSKHEISSEVTSSFEEALGMMELPRKEKKSTKRKVETDHNNYENGELCSSSGATFEEALGMIEIPRKKKRLIERSSTKSPALVENVSLPESIPVPLPNEPLEKIELTTYLPPITPNYKPIRLPDAHHVVDETTFMDNFMKNKNYRTKIYSGNKSSVTKVPSLLDICLNLLQDHIDDMEATGGVPYSILKPVLERASPSQLLRLEYYNSYLTEDSDELWKLHCQKDFRNKTRQECETWREMYTRCTEEREARFLTLTASIKESKQKSVPVRTTKIAYIDPPMAGARRQVKNSAAPMAKAKVEALVRDSKSSSDVIVNHQNRASRSQNTPSVSTTQSKVKKMAPLMAKSLSAFKNRRYK